MREKYQWHFKLLFMYQCCSLLTIMLGLPHRLGTCHAFRHLPESHVCFHMHVAGAPFRGGLASAQLPVNRHIGAPQCGPLSLTLTMHERTITPKSMPQPTTGTQNSTPRPPTANAKRKGNGHIYRCTTMWISLYNTLRIHTGVPKGGPLSTTHYDKCPKTTP